MLEKEMATHSSILAWRISLTEKPGALQSTGSREELDPTEVTDAEPCKFLLLLGPQSSVLQGPQTVSLFILW